MDVTPGEYLPDVPGVHQHERALAMTIDDNDQRHPAEVHAEGAAQEIRAFNHATLMQDSIQHTSTVYRTLGELYTLTGYLNQACEQLARALATQLDAGTLQVDEGTEFAGNPDLAVAAASDHLEHAVQANKVVYQELTAAQSAISGLYAR